MNGVQIVKPMESRYEDYLRDESKLEGCAESISFPETEEQVVEIVRYMSANGKKITVQGGKTGISGGAVPSMGHILNLTNMKRILALEKDESGTIFVKVQPGITLLELSNQLCKRSFKTEDWDTNSMKTLSELKKGKEQFWVPDPTETSASVGGVASCNSQGICAYLYGETRNYIEGIRVVLADGTIRDIHRGQYKFHEDSYTFNDEKVLNMDCENMGLIQDCDLIDVYLGREGMFGVITELTLRLITKPLEIWGISFFFLTDDDAFGFAQGVHEAASKFKLAKIAAIEYLDRMTIDCIEQLKKTVTKLQELPDVKKEFAAMIYIEIHGNTAEDVEEIAEQMIILADEWNSDSENAWAISGENEMEKIRTFRHAAPEAVNNIIDQAHQKDKRIIKLGTDMRIDGEPFAKIMKMYKNDIKEKKLKAAIFGHVGGSHVHVNILPDNFEEYLCGKAMFEKWAVEISEKGGSATAEHGVGKLKKDLFRLTASKETLENIYRLKKQLDPDGVWNPGNVLD